MVDDTDGTPINVRIQALADEHLLGDDDNMVYRRAFISTMADMYFNMRLSELAEPLSPGTEQLLAETAFWWAAYAVFQHEVFKKPLPELPNIRTRLS